MFVAFSVFVFAHSSYLSSELTFHNLLGPEFDFWWDEVILDYALDWVLINWGSLRLPLSTPAPQILVVIGITRKVVDCLGIVT